MDTWRGMVVLFCSAIGGCAGVAAWFIVVAPQWAAFRNSGAFTPNQISDIQLIEQGELLCTFMASIFVSGKITARVLIGKDAEAEIAASGRWRIVPLQFFVGVGLVVMRFLLGIPTFYWTWDHTIEIGVGALLITMSLREAWRYWILPNTRPRSGF